MDIETGEKVGEHLGLHHWTVGQGAKLGGYLKPYFIAYKDLTSNTIYVVSITLNIFNMFLIRFSIFRRKELTILLCLHNYFIPEHLIGSTRPKIS